MSLTPELLLSSFAACIGETFAVVDAEPQIEFELLEAEPLRVRPTDSDPEHQFALLFAGPADPPLDQQTLRLRHVNIGELALFVVPVAERDGRRHYESIINRTS